MSAAELGGRIRAARAALDREARVRQALKLLDEQRSLVRRGDLAGLARLSPRLEAALETLATAFGQAEGRAAETELDALRATAERNGRLLEATLAGARDARAMLAAGRAARTQLGYDRAGAIVSAEAGKGGRTA